MVNLPFQISIHYNISGDSDVLSDISPFSGVVTIEDGASFAVVTVESVDDVIPEVATALYIFVVVCLFSL